MHRYTCTDTHAQIYLYTVSHDERIVAHIFSFSHVLYNFIKTQTTMLSLSRSKRVFDSLDMVESFTREIALYNKNSQHYCDQTDSDSDLDADSNSNSNSNSNIGIDLDATLDAVLDAALDSIMDMEFATVPHIDIDTDIDTDTDEDSFFQYLSSPITEDFFDIDTEENIGTAIFDDISILEEELDQDLVEHYQDMKLSKDFFCVESENICDALYCN